MAEEDPDEPSEGESEESSSRQQPGGETGEESADEPEETGAEDDELTPEELAEEVLEDDPETGGSADDPDEEASEESPEETEESPENASDDELSPEELAEDVLQEEPPPDDESEEPDEPEPESSSPAEEPESEAPEAGEDEPEADDDELSPEELAEEVLNEESDPSETSPAEDPEKEGGEPPEESEGTTESDDTTESEEQLLDEEDTVEDSGDEDAAGEPDSPEPSESEDSDASEPESEEGFQEPAEEEVPREPDDTEGDEADQGDADDETDDGEASIQDMLEQEAKRSREEEEQEDEGEELPEGYMTVEQLPEQEEFELPGWSKTAGWVLLWLATAGLVIWYLAMPLWEVYLMNQTKSSLERNNYSEARSWVEIGLFLNGAFVKNDGPFLADYLKQLLNHREFERFRSAYRDLAPGVKPPLVQQTFTEYLLNRGRWEDARSTASTLQRWVKTRGMGYLFHAKASLELGNLEMAQSDLNQVTNWMSEHPAARRILRDIYFRQGNYQNALETSNQLQDLAGTDPWQMKVDDYVRLAQINKKLDKRRVAQQMLERALELNPNHQGALRELGRQYLLEGRWERAEPLVSGSDYREGYRSLFPFEGFGWWAGAEIELSNDNVAQGIRYVERAVDLEPRNPEVHRVEGTLYLDRLSQPAQAVNSYERAQELGLRRLTFYNKLGQAYYRSGEYLAAARTFEALKAELGDTQPALTYNIGSAYLGAGEFEKARERIRSAFNQGFRNQKSYNQWGLLLELEGRTQDALAKYFEGIEWGRRQNEPVDLVQSNLDRAFSKENPDPLSDWLAPLSTDFEIPTWRTMEPDG